MGNLFDVLSRVSMRVLEFIMVVMMVGMLLLVGLNVFLRIGFNSGIDFADEIPRFMFVWLTFCGAVVAMKQRTHINVNMFVEMSPRTVRTVFYVITQSLVLVCGGYLFYGTGMLHEVIADNASPVLQISTLWVFGVTYVAGAGLLLIAASNLIRLMMGRIDDDELAGRPARDDESTGTDGNAGVAP
ncbi:TRAP transporter small permease [Uliginosibacterium sp. sgz301328]|uniref:TRAP transporter small permease n=1 Tax=Uliginosibacterium sp. sgz301328 TaxID=3243764 RepID=UPI00359DFFA6